MHLNQLIHGSGDHKQPLLNENSLQNRSMRTINHVSGDVPGWLVVSGCNFTHCDSVRLRPFYELHQCESLTTAMTYFS